MNVNKVDLIMLGLLCFMWDYIGNEFSWLMFGTMFVTYGVVGIVADLVWKGINSNE